MTVHKQVRVRNPFPDSPETPGRWVYVDEEIEPLLRCLWKQGWITYASCQNPNEADRQMRERRVAEHVGYVERYLRRYPDAVPEIFIQAQLERVRAMYRPVRFMHSTGFAYVCFCLKEHALAFTDWLFGAGADPSTWSVEGFGWETDSRMVYFPRTLLLAVQL
jgi:hypothetical protein